MELKKSNSTLTLITTFLMPPSTIPTTMTHGPFFHPKFLRNKYEPLAMPKTYNAVTLLFTATFCIQFNI